MRPLIYDIAITLDGFIARADGSIPGFPMTGPHADDYMARLATYGAVLMGRATYEWGYAYGLKPGARAYPHMDHFIASHTLKLPSSAEVEITEDPVALARALRASDGSPIYLCGGGRLAGDLARAGLIDKLTLKVAPLIYGEGRPLFAGPLNPQAFECVERTGYPNGVTLLEMVPSPASAG